MLTRLRDAARLVPSSGPDLRERHQPIVDAVRAGDDAAAAEGARGPAPQ